MVQVILNAIYDFFSSIVLMEFFAAIVFSSVFLLAICSIILVFHVKSK